MIVIYELFNGGLDIDPDQFFSVAGATTTRGHSMKLKKPQAISRARRNTPAVRAVNDWDSLPQYVILSSSINQSKSSLDNHWKDLTYIIPD